MSNTTATAAMATNETRLDVRPLPPRERHAAIFDTWHRLARHESLLLVNDHDPVPLYFQFEQTRLGQFDWRYLEAGPEQWHVRISRVAAGVPSGVSRGCGGGCACSGG